MRSWIFPAAMVAAGALLSSGAWWAHLRYENGENPGRYQVTAVPGEFGPKAVMVDTGTGETWFFCGTREREWGWCYIPGTGQLGLKASKFNAEWERARPKRELTDAEAKQVGLDIEELIDAGTTGPRHK